MAKILNALISINTLQIYKIEKMIKFRCNVINECLLMNEGYQQKNVSKSPKYLKDWIQLVELQLGIQMYAIATINEQLLHYSNKRVGTQKK